MISTPAIFNNNRNSQVHASVETSHTVLDLAINAPVAQKCAVAIWGDQVGREIVSECFGMQRIINSTLLSPSSNPKNYSEHIPELHTTGWPITSATRATGQKCCSTEVDDAMPGPVSMPPTLGAEEEPSEPSYIERQDETRSPNQPQEAQQEVTHQPSHDKRPRPPVGAHCGTFHVTRSRADAPKFAHNPATTD